MRDELEKQLQLDFPFMKQNRVRDEKNTYKRCGCECKDGWYDLIHELCQSISERYERDGKPVDIVVLQIKQKFATLRFYYEFEDLKCPIQAFDFLGDGKNLRYSPGVATTDECTAKLRKDIAEIVHSYEKKSATVCEMCGSHGQRKNASQYYVRTLCDSCYAEYLKKMEERKRN